jgi:L-alanine-DL-glutamate epimerase-like enolase superfamily enzyme
MTAPLFADALSGALLARLPGPLTVERAEWFAYPSRNRNLQDQTRLALRLTDASGAVGGADFPLWKIPDREAAQDALTRRLLARDARDLVAIWDELYAAGTHLHLLALADIALWDLCGRVAGRPVHALLGTRRRRVPVYVHSPFNLPMDEYVRIARDSRHEGFHGFKVHPTVSWQEPRTGDPDRDIAICRAVREAVGPDFLLTLDPYNTYGYSDALRVGRVAEELGYGWYESPMPETDDWIDRYVRLRAELSIPLCAPECAPGSWDVRARWVERGATDIGRIDVYAGGFTPCLRLAAACDAAGLPLELHTFGEFYHLQLLGAATDRQCRHLESGTTRRNGVLVAESSPRLGRISKPGHLTDEPLADADGTVAVPDTPGMGIDLDWPWITSHRTG